MRVLPGSLGAKLNLLLLVFVLLLGAATAAIIFYGFNRSQDDATERSQEALEEQGKLALQALVGGVSESGGLQIEWAAEIGHRAGRYLQEFKASGATAEYDTSRFVRTDEGIWYDPDPGRVSDVVVPNHVEELQPAHLDDIAYSAALDPLLPALTEGFPGELSGEGFRPIAIIFIGVNGVGRYYPPIGIQESTPAELDVSDFLDRFGPTANPGRSSVWTPPYEDLNGRGLVITAQTPIYEGDLFRGIFEVDLLISNLVAELDGVRSTTSGFAFYVDVEGGILGSRASQIHNQQDAGGAEFAAILEAMRAAPQGPGVPVERVTLDDEEYFIAYTPLPVAGGSLAAAAPVDEVTAQAAPIAASIGDEGARTLGLMLAGMGGLFVAALLGATYLNRRLLVRPLQSMVAGIRAVAAGDLTTKIPVTSGDELGMLALTFNDMTSQLAISRDQLEAQQQRIAGSEAELRALFSAMTDLVAVIDRDGRYLRAAPTHPDHRYPPADDLIGRDVHDMLPAAAADSLLAAVRRAIDTDSAQPVEIQAPVEGQDRWLQTIVTPLPDGTALAVARDVTERVRAGELLEQRVEERTRELAALLDVAQRIASELSVAELVDTILLQIGELFESTASSVAAMDEEGNAVFLGSNNPHYADAGIERGFTYSMAPFGAIWESIRRDQAVSIDDVRDEDDEMAAVYRQAVGPQIDTFFSGVRSWMGVPMTVKERVVGWLIITHAEPARYDAHDLQLARALASQAAVAIENARLYEETERRAREMAALLEVSHSVASTLELGPLVTVIVEQLRNVLEHNGASVLLRERDALVVLDLRGRTRAGGSEDFVFPLDAAAELWALVERAEPILVDDIRADTPVAEGFRRSAGPRIDTMFANVRSWMGIPLAAKQGVIGMLAITHAEPGAFTQRDVQLARAVADQAALAIENARLFEETERRAREMEALFRADAELFRSLSTDAVFLSLCDVVVDLLGADKCMVTTIEDESGRYTVRASRGLSRESLVRMAAIRAEQPRAVLGTMRESIINEDVRAAMPEMAEVFDAESIESTIDVPFQSASGLRGALGAAYTARHRFGAEEQRMLQAIADRAAIAIDNAELYERAQQAASLEERQRLARELHDSVSQALYGIALGARTARTQLDRDPAQAVEPVEYVMSLAEAGLAEMRALIFELRPESLETEGLVAAIEKQIASTRARYGIGVEAALCDEPDVRLDVKEALYRIAQEALHNIVKHAQAAHVEVSLATDGAMLTLRVTDDGRGFDPDGSFPGHVGLHSMRERTARLGGEITIESTPGRGTRLTVTIPVTPPRA
ncbi:MAG: GAF domain-containing protein [Dehalococcoidia bacterium]